MDEATVSAVIGYSFGIVIGWYCRKLLEPSPATTDVPVAMGSHKHTDTKQKAEKPIGTRAPWANY